MLYDRSPARQLVDGLDRRRDRESDILFATYIRPRGRGQHVVRLPGSTAERIVGTSLGRTSFKPGAAVPLGRMSGEATQFVIGQPPPGRAGASGFPLNAPQPGRIDSTRILAADPDLLDIGVSDQLVTLAGFGFATDDVLRAMVYDLDAQDWIADPYAMLHDYTFVNQNEATVEVDIAAGAPAGYRYTVRTFRAWEV